MQRRLSFADSQVGIVMEIIALYLFCFNVTILRSVLRCFVIIIRSNWLYIVTRNLIEAFLSRLTPKGMLTLRIYLYTI